MEVCYQLPVLPLDRQVPKHVLGRRGAICITSGSGLFGGPAPRQLSKRRGGVSYDSSEQMVLYIHMIAHTDTVISRVKLQPGRALGIHNNLHTPYYCGKDTQEIHPTLDQEYVIQAKCMLQKVESWNFNVFLFDQLTNGKSLVDLTFHLFTEYSLIKLFELDVLKLRHFLVMVQESYHRQNPYHNALHATDVTQAMYCFLQEPQLFECLTSCDILLGLLAAATHDLDHPGVNQTFLIKSSHHLAFLYQNMSVLENHHWKFAVSLLRESGLLSHLSSTDRQSLEKQLGSLILATDINRQDEYLCEFRAHLDRADLHLNNSHNRHFILQMALKCADICNPCRPWHLTKIWSHKITEEFFRQGDKERRKNLDVSILCDRNVYSVGKIQIGTHIHLHTHTHTHTHTYIHTCFNAQPLNSHLSIYTVIPFTSLSIGFISFLVEPLFAEWARFSDSPLSRVIISHMTSNKLKWTHSTQENM